MYVGLLLSLRVSAAGKHVGLRILNSCLGRRRHPIQIELAVIFLDVEQARIMVCRRLLLSCKEALAGSWLRLRRHHLSILI